MTSAVFLALLVLSPGPPEKSATGAFPPGEIVPRVECAGDPAHSYALYLPAAYSRDRTWPVLYLYDPRRRTAGDRRGALDSLRAAVEKGFRDTALIETDPDLASLRGEMQYRSIVEELKKPSR